MYENKNVNFGCLLQIYVYTKDGKLNSFIMKITAKENDTNDILQKFR